MSAHNVLAVLKYDSGVLDDYSIIQYAAFYFILRHHYFFIQGALSQYLAIAFGKQYSFGMTVMATGTSIDLVTPPILSQVVSVGTS